ncbi:MAG: LysR family transcriptional regulator [Burkholderiaceae bacterium]
MDTLRAMRTFVRFVELKSLAKAAEDLSIEKGTASKVLQQLEARLGIRLVERHARRLKVTDEGLSYYQDAKQILLDVERAESRARGDTRQAKGRLLVEVPSVLAHNFLAPLLPEFLAQNPDLQVELMVSDRALDIVECGIDVSLRIGQPSELDSAARRLGASQSIVCAAPSYRSPRLGVTVGEAGHRMLESPQDLCDEQCLIALHPSEGWRRRWDLTHLETGARASIEISGPLSVSSAALLIDLAARGTGIVNVAEAIVSNELRDGRLVQLLSQWHGEETPLYALYAPIRPLPQRISAFLDFLSNRVRDHAMQSIEALHKAQMSESSHELTAISEAAFKRPL